MRRFVRALVSVVLVSAAVVPWQASDEEPEKIPRTRLEHFRAEMEKIRFQVINVGARVKGGSVSMGMRSGEVADTPANRCCALNVVRIEEHLANLVVRWQDLNACYETEGSVDAQVKLNFVRADAGSLVRAYENFRGAESDGLLLPGLQAMTKGFMLLEESVDELDECGEKVVR